jgi:energy-coupling factor transporter transmembrane protein EcfT
MMPAGAVAAPARDWWLGRLHPATRGAALPLLVATCLAAPAWALPPLLLLLAVGLARSGLGWRRQLGALWPWWPLALLALGVHTVTAVSAAPLGHPSVTGLLRGLAALGRVAAMVAGLGLLGRMFSLADLVSALAWWGQAVLRRSVDPGRLGLVLAVALGTIPTALAEGRRIQTALAMRRAGAVPVGAAADAAGGALGDGALAGATAAGATAALPAPARRRRAPRWWRAALDRASIVVPLLEGLFRRAESLSLALRYRLPRPRPLGPVPWAQALGLGLWLALLIYGVIRW